MVFTLNSLTNCSLSKEHSRFSSQRVEVRSCIFSRFLQFSLSISQVYTSWQHSLIQDANTVLRRNTRLKLLPENLKRAKLKMIQKTRNRWFKSLLRKAYFSIFPLMAILWQLQWFICAEIQTASHVWSSCINVWASMTLAGIRLIQVSRSPRFHLHRTFRSP